MTGMNLLRERTMKNNYPVKKQVCTVEQAKKLAELLGDDAPKGVWMWEYYESIGGKWGLRLRTSFELSKKEKYPAYTSAELGILLPKVLNQKKAREFPDEPLQLLDMQWLPATKSFHFMYQKTPFHSAHRIEAQAKADLAIQILEAKRIKSEEFSYEK